MRMIGCECDWALDWVFGRNRLVLGFWYNGNNVGDGALCGQT